MYSLFIEAVSVINTKNSDCVDGSNKETVQVTQKDFDAIQVSVINYNSFSKLSVLHN